MLLQSRRAVLFLATLLGLAIWLVPAVLFSQPEPWDGDGLAYPLALLGSGLVLGYLGPNQRVAAVVGVFAGQLGVLLGRVILSPGTSELWVVGVVFLAGYTCIVTGLGAVLGSVIRARLGPRPTSRISDE